MKRLLLVIMLAGCGCGEDPTQTAWQVDPQALADRLNRQQVRPETRDEWQGCKVEGYGTIVPFHACEEAAQRGYATRCLWYPGVQTSDGTWKPLNSEADGEPGAVCVCGVSDFAVDKVCGESVDSR